jgi:hypothetical protein
MLSGFRSSIKSGCVLLLLVTAGTGMTRAAELATPQQIAARVESAPPEHPLTPALKMGDEALQKAAQLKDYEGLFIKKEYVGNTFVEQKMVIRFRRDPMSVYLKFVEPSPGRKVMYVKGQNNGQIQVKETGLASLVGAINVDPHGSLAMSESRYPITMIGLENMTRRLLGEWLDATDRNDITVKFYPNAKIGNVDCEVIESTHTDAIKSKGIYRARLYIDKQSGLPIRIQEYAFPRQAGGEPPLLADYCYLNLRPNIGLTARHFDPGSPQSEF